MKLEKIDNKGNSLQLLMGSDTSDTERRRKTCSIIEDEKLILIGRDETKDEIITKLLNLDGKVQFFPLVGTGGIGKTSLAQAIYNDERLTEEYYPEQCRHWVEDRDEKFDAKNLIRQIIAEPESPRETLEVLQRKLIYKLKKDCRFLIVLENVGKVDRSEWEKFWIPLTSIGKEGAVIATSRLEEIRNATGDTTPNYLKPLSDEDCWMIFEKHALTGGSCTVRPELEATGRKMVSMLKGNPLALKVVGCSLLDHETDEREWEKLVDSKIWTSRRASDDIMPALEWIYSRLPSHLKQCFAYCSTYSKDDFIEPKELVRLWMAQGLIRASGGGGERPEDVGDRCFRELVNASLLQNVDVRHRKLCHGPDKRLMMHDVIHDLAASVAGDAAVSEDDRRLVAEPERIRHVRIVAYGGGECPDLSKCRRLSSVYLSNLCFFDFRSLLERLRCLRVLVLRYLGLREIPENIGGLKLLRLLDLEGNDLGALPESVSDLHNLQTLVVSDETLLPRGLSKLVNLRYLNATVTISKGGIRIEDLEQLPHLSGSLSLAGLRSVSTGEEASQAMLKERKHLDMLDLHWDGEEEEEEEEVEEEEDIREAEAVAEALDPPPSLKTLRVRGYDMVRWPSWLLSAERLSLLERVTLCECWEVELLPPLGELPLLKELRLEDNEGVKRLGCEFYGRRARPAFPALTELEIVRFRGLEEWGTAGGDTASFPCLQRLVISQCPELRSLPLASGDLVSIRNLSIHHCPALALSDRPSPSPSPTASKGAASASALLPLPNLACFETDSKLVSHQLLKHWDLNAVVDLTVVPTHSNGERWDGLASLRELTLGECEEAEWSLPPELASLTSLHELSIYQCRGQFPSFRSGGLPASLRAVKVSLCDDVESLPPQLGCTPIKELAIDWCSALQSVPGECLPPTLEALDLSSCSKLESLPPQVATLPQLRELCVRDCENLRSLPDGGLPPSLQILEVIRCPLLEEKCQERGGPEWHKLLQSQALKLINGVMP